VQIDRFVAFQLDYGAQRKTEGNPFEVSQINQQKVEIEQVQNNELALLFLNY